MAIKVGDRLPEGTLTEMIDTERAGCTIGPNNFSVSEQAKGKRIAIFAVPGAFTPTCSAKHVPSATYTKALGLDMDLTARSMGARSQRYSMLVEDGVVTRLNVEAGEVRGEQWGGDAGAALSAPSRTGHQHVGSKGGRHARGARGCPGEIPAGIPG